MWPLLKALEKKQEVQQGGSLNSTRNREHLLLEGNRKDGEHSSDLRFKLWGGDVSG